MRTRRTTRRRGKRTFRLPQIHLPAKWFELALMFLGWFVLGFFVFQVPPDLVADYPFSNSYFLFVVSVTWTVAATAQVVWLNLFRSLLVGVLAGASVWLQLNQLLNWWVGLILLALLVVGWWVSRE